MIDTDRLNTEARQALEDINAEMAHLRNERKAASVRIAELEVEKRRLTRIVNAFQPRIRKARTDGGSE